MDEILSQIPQSNFEGSAEPTIIYRLGNIENTTHDLVKLFAEIEYPPHYHVEAEGPILFVVGEGRLVLDNEEIDYSPGKSFFIPKKVRHGFKPKTDTLFLSIQTPPVKKMSGEEDLFY